MTTAHAVKFVSVGEICAPAYYLRELGMRDAAYPFDWLHSSAPIVQQCIEDRFATFLNPRYITPAADGPGSSHAIYHESFFRHREAHTPEGLAYYERAVKRFQRVLEGPDPVVFVSMLAEPAVHRGWLAGFRESVKPQCGEFRQTLEWWDARVALGALHLPHVRVATVILQRSRRSDFSCSSSGASIHALLSIQGTGGAPFEHPEDHAAALALFRRLELVGKGYL